MTREVQQLSVKLYAPDIDDVESDLVIRTFHTWIQTSALDDMLIDVTDYSHVPRGPGVLLIAHDAQLGVDASDGRWGLAYRRKRDEPGPVREKLFDALRQTLAAARLAQTTEPLAGQLPLTPRELWIRVHNRLLAPNTPATFEALAGELTSTLEALYQAPIELEQDETPDELFAVRARASAEPSFDELLSRLGPR